ncbi:MAG: hypothetical protein JWN60_557 [Acidobacteria bacterium]|nr:hypothetical protein [Acidobacteriota bacterium]
MISIRKFLIIAQFILLITVSALTVSADGEVDPFFNTSAYKSDGTGVRVLAQQSDGKVLIGGSFTAANGFSRQGIARLNADGTTDTGFTPPGIFDPTLNANNAGATIFSIAVQADGKIIVGGRFKVVNSTYENLIRLNTDGTLDNSFRDLSPQFDEMDFVGKVIVRPDDSIFIAGSFDWLSPTPISQIAKLDTNGAPIEGFQLGVAGTIREFTVQPDDKIIISHQFVERRNADGSVDSTFQSVSTNGDVTEIVAQPDGKILIGGTFTTVNGSPRGRIARLNGNGTLDETFNPNGSGASSGSINDIEIASGGKIYIGGTFTQFNGVNRSKAARLNADGTLDTSFNYIPVSTNTVIHDIEQLSGGKIVVAGDATGAADDSVSQLNADGSIDTNFSAKVGRTGRVREIVQQLDGKVYIAGEFTYVNGVNLNSFARVNANGTLDTDFVPFFNDSPDQILYAVAPLSNGKVYVGGAQGIVLRRLNADGSEDTEFNANLEGSSVIYDIALMPNGQILIAGNFKESRTLVNRRLARLNSDGTIDASFNPGLPNGDVYKILRQPNGRILIAGDFTQIDAAARGRIARLANDGSIDNSFDPQNGANAAVYDLDLQTDGKIIVGGAFTSLGGNANQQRIGRLNADGTPDAGFAQTANSNVYAVKVQPDNQILIGGSFTQVQGTARNGLARLNANGSLDFNFNADANSVVLDINLQTDNKILLGGEFTEINNISRVRVARLFNVAAPPKVLFDYDGDRKADISVYRPSTNRWYILLSSDSTVVEYSFGIEGDIIAPADFDGDGKTDIAIFRPSSGDWWYLSSVDNIQKSVHWGQAGDIPLPGDFDGDGRADFILYRPSETNWYRLSSSGEISIPQFGAEGDKPVTGDFDGDRKTDAAIFRPSTGDWWWQSSFDNIQRATHWGLSTDIPVAADYDGDGRTDFAVFRPSEGAWYINNSSGSNTIMNFGLAGDKPVAADYDGDGRADIAVYRPSEGVWYLLRSRDGFAAYRFGISTDIPTPFAFVP